MTFGGLIEQVTSESARKAIKSLIQISPQTATVLTGGEEKILPEALIDRHATWFTPAILTCAAIAWAIQAMEAVPWPC